MQKLKDLFTKYRKAIFITLAVLLASIIGLISFYSYKMYIESLSVETRIEKIKNAIALVSFEDLTNFVDFRQLSQGMADVLILDSRLNFPADATAISISESMQKNLLELLKNKEVKEEDSKITIFDPLIPLPLDFFVQFHSTLKIIEKGENAAIIEVTIDNIRTTTNVQIKFLMQNTESYGWRILKILNPEELIEHFYHAKKKIRSQVVNFINEKNKIISDAMDKYFSITSCTVGIANISSNSDKILIIEIKGHNNGPYIVFNFNVNTTYYNSKTKKEVTAFSLNLARRVFPNENFSNSWSLGIDLDNPKHQLLLDNLPLSCVAEFNNMGLSSGKVLYLTEMPEEN